MSADVDVWKWRNLIASEHGPPDPITRLVLLTVSLHMNQRGENAYPSQKLIALRAGLSERSVRTHLEKASNAGWVNVYIKGKTGQGWRNHEYVPSIPTSLESIVPDHPWEADRTYKRAEQHSAPSSRPTKRRAEVASSPSLVERAHEDTSALLAACPQNIEGAEDGAKGAEDGAKGAEYYDTTCGTSFQKVRHHVPINISYNNSYNNPINISEECALSDESTRVIVDDDSTGAKSNPLLRKVRVKRQLSYDELAAKVERLREVTGDSPDAMVKILGGSYDGITADRVLDVMRKPISRGALTMPATQH